MLYRVKSTGRRFRTGLGDLGDDSALNFGPPVATFDDPNGQPAPSPTVLTFGPPAANVFTFGPPDQSSPAPAAPPPNPQIQLAQIQANTQATQAQYGFFSSLASGLANAGGAIGAAFVTNNKGQVLQRPSSMVIQGPAPVVAPSSSMSWLVPLGVLGGLGALFYFGKKK